MTHSTALTLARDALMNSSELVFIDPSKAGLRAEALAAIAAELAASADAGRQPYTPAHHFALREAYWIEISEAFWQAHPGTKDLGRESILYAGFVRGFNIATKIADERAALARPAPAIPRGWRIYNTAEGEIAVCLTDGKLGYLASKDTVNIASCVLYELATSLLEGGFVPNDRLIERHTLPAPVSGLIERREVISKPDAAIRVEKLHLTDEGRAMLTSGVESIPAPSTVKESLQVAPVSAQGDERAAFEAWIAKRETPFTNWQLWQAARAQVAPSMPPDLLSALDRLCEQGFMPDELGPMWEAFRAQQGGQE